MSTDFTSPMRRATLTLLSVSAAAALALSACAPENETDAENDTDQVEDTSNSDTEEDTGQEEDPADTETEDDAASDSETDDDQSDDDNNGTDGTSEDDQSSGAVGEHPVYQAFEAALAEYPDGIITEFDDNSHDDGYIEVYIYDGSTEWELEIDSETFEIIKVEDDGIDADDEAEAQAVEIDIAEALQTAEQETGAEPHEGGLDTEAGTVVWEFEMSNDVDVYIDVTTGEVVGTD